MIRQDSVEVRPVLRPFKVEEDISGKLGKGLVCRGEDGVRSLAREYADKLPRLEQEDERGEVRRGGG